MILFKVFMFSSVIFLSQEVLSNRPFSWVDCGRSGHKAVEVLKVNIYPHPILIPGNVRITIQAKILKPIYPTEMFKVDIYKLHSIGTVNIPCIKGVVVCDYDVCGLVNQSLHSGGPDENSIIGQALHKFVLAGADLTCPIPPQTIGIYDYLVPIHQQENHVIKMLMDGDFEVRVRLLNAPSGEEMGCVQINATISQDISSGFLFR